MKIKFLKVKGTWREVADAARTTIRREEGEGEPSSRWKKRILLAEHSPIRKLCFNWKWIDLPYWVSVHFVRHKFGIEHFVSTQRTDRTGEDRNSKSQDAPVVHECFANAQAVMFISRRRLCGQASPETRAAWKAVVDEIAYLKEKYGVTDPAILSAIRWHTTGRAGMTQLEQILFIADYIEPGRNKVAELPYFRRIAFEDLDETCYLILQNMLAYLDSKEDDIDETTRFAYDYYRTLHEKAAGVDA